MMHLPVIESADALARLVEEIGFLPFFRCGIPGYSLEELTPRERWFTDLSGPWEWRQEMGERGVFYGKFFRGKAVFVSRAWYPAFANMRRDGMEVRDLYGDGLLSREELAIYEAVSGAASLRKDEIKRQTGAGKALDRELTRLQMLGYLVIAGFEQKRDRFMRPYGWEVACYALPEKLLGQDEFGFDEEPEEAMARVAAQIGLVTGAEEETVQKLIAM